MSMSKGNSNLDALIVSAAHVLVDDAAEYMRSIDTSETVISKSLDKRVHRKIRKHKRDRWWNSVPVTCKKVVAAIMVFCTISFAMSMSVEAVREEVWNTKLEWYDKFVAVFYVTEKTPPSVIEEYREPTLQLAGADKQVILQNDMDYCLIYTVDDVKMMTYQQRLITNHSSDLDSESCEVTNISIHEYNAQLFVYSDGTRTLTWHDDEYAYIITINSTAVDTNELLDIAESIK